MSKRLFDCIVAAAGLLLLTPLFLVIAVAIKLDSKGPVWFRQERVGQGGQRFFIHKFRTMVADAPARPQLQLVRKVLSYLPSSHRHLPPVVKTDDDPDRRLDDILAAAERAVRPVSEADMSAPAPGGVRAFEASMMFFTPSLTSFARAAASLPRCSASFASSNVYASS